MNVGRLRHRVELQVPVVTVVSGEPSTSWQTYDTAWASIEPLRGREYWEAAKVNSEVSAKIVMRWRRGVKPQMRCKYGPRIFEVVSVLDKDERNRTLELMVTERMVS